MMKSSLVCGLLFGFAVTSFAEVTAAGIDGCLCANRRQCTDRIEW
jgi:hypothetical protein